MMRGNTSLLVILLMSSMLLTTRPAPGQTITFRKIADTNTPVPDGTGTFDTLSEPCLDQGNVVFVGTNTSTSPDQVGVYLDVEGTLTVVADGNTPVPGGGGDFVYFDSRSLSISGTNVAFRALTSGGSEGVYTSIDGVISAVADTATAAPGAPGDFAGFGRLSLGDGVVVFGAGVSEPPSLDGYYTNLGGSLRVVADFNTLVPGGTGTFDGFINGVSIDEGVIAFAGESGGKVSLCMETGGTLSVVADGDTPIPGGTGDFGLISYPSLDGENIAFRHASNGIYLVTATGVELVADSNTPVPEGSGDFATFDVPSLDRANVAFRGIGSYNGVYTRMGGSIIKIADPTDQIDGKTPTILASREEALSGNQVAFYIVFQEDDSEGVFVATVADMCGNTVVEGIEQCDDGNIAPGDGCDENCRFDPPIPAVTAWGVAVMLLLLLAAGTIIIRRHGAVAP